MGTIVALAVGLVFWVTAWSLGLKALDAFLVTLALVLIAATGRLVSPYVRERLLP